MANLLAQNKFAALADLEAESEEETLEETALGDQQSNSSEAEAEKELLELLNSWVRSCPDYGGSVREAASQEIEARIGWLAAQASLHPCLHWQAVVAREFCLCEDALQSLRRSSAFS